MEPPSETIQRNDRLVVRVKRRRDEEPSDSICIVTNRSLLLKRVRTVGYIDKSDLDNQTVDLKINSGLNERGINSSNSDNNKRSSLEEKNCKVIVAKSRKTLSITANNTFAREPTNSDQNSLVVIDMTQMTSTVSSTEEVEGATQSVEDNRTKVLDPPTRLLDKGIKLALEMGDFNDIAAALMQGANVNHQRRSLSSTSGSSILEGYTALMAASQQGNLRMVKRLLGHNADVNLKAKNGKTALDLLKQSRSPRGTAAEINSLLQQTLRKTAARAITAHNKVARHSGEALLAEEDTAFEVDLFTMDHSQLPMDMTEASQHYEASATNATTTAAFAAPVASFGGWTETEGVREVGRRAGLGSTVPIIPVEGVQISEEGAVHLLMSYDSDWSDLCDDEDPDSNDERFEGNDYPDEDDEEILRVLEEEEEEEKARETLGARSNGSARAKNILDDDYSDNGNEDDYRESYDRYEIEGEEVDSDYDFNEAYDSDSHNRMPRFDRSQGIGKVIRPRVLGSTAEGAHEEALDSHLYAKHDSQSLRELWGENMQEGQGGLSEGALGRQTHDNNGAFDDHNKRLHDMRNRTGMLFASNPREFDPITGLAKYGCDLSDDETGFGSLGQTMNGFLDVPRPASNTVAYDSDLDNSN